MITRVLLVGGAAMVGYLLSSLVADPALADPALPEPVAAAEASAPDLRAGGSLGSTVEATLDGLLPGGAGGGDPSETDPPPEPSRESQPDPPSASSGEEQPAPPAEEPVRELLESSAPAEAGEPVVVVEQLLPRVEGTAGEAVSQVGEQVDAVSTAVTRLSCDAMTEWELPELCLPELGLPELEQPDLGLPDLGSPGADEPAPGHGHGPSSPEPWGTVVEGPVVTVAAPPGPVAAYTGDLIAGPPVPTARALAAVASPPPQTAAASPLSPPVATADDLADPAGTA